MTVGITSQDPTPAALNVGTRPFIRASVTGGVLDPVTQSSVNIDVSGAPVVVAGVAQSGWDVWFTENAAFGVDVSVRKRVALAGDEWHSVRVRAGDLDTSWSFRTAESRGPRLVNVTPALGSDEAIGLPLIEFDVVDDSGEVQRRVLEDESDDGELSGSQLTVPGIDMRGTLDQLVEIDGNLAFITALIGPHIVVTTYSGSGSGLNVKLFKRNGIDVTVSGARIVKSGEAISNVAWSTTITEPNPGQWHFAIQKIGSSIADGERVDVDVTAQDDTVAVDNVTRTHTHFFVGDVRGPVIRNTNPAPGTRGLSTNQVTNQPVFDILDTGSGVDSATINVYVDGVHAIDAGMPVGNWSGSQVDPITDGYQITLKKGSAWPGPKEVFVSVEAADNDGNEMLETTWLWHVGATSETHTANTGGGELVSNNVVRTVAFDLSRASFADPVTMRHSGFAWDGYWYEDGFKNTGHARASWALEASGANRATRDEFPVSGHLVITPASWSILDAAGRMWMRCQALGSGTVANWSMAGGIDQTLADCDFAGGQALMVLAAGADLIVIDFAADAAKRFSVLGMEESDGAIATRNSDQSSVTTADDAYMLSDSESAFAHVACVAVQGLWLAIGVRDAQVELVGDIEASVRSEIESQRGAFLSQGNSVVLPVPEADGGVWARVRARHTRFDAIEPLVAAFADGSGDACLLVCDWLSVFAYLQSPIAVIDSPLTGDEGAVDCDHVIDADGKWIVAVATEERVLLVELSAAGDAATVIDDLDLADLDLDTVASAAVAAVALGTGFNKERGYLFAACAAASDGKAVRWRHQPASASTTGQLVVLDSGAPVRSLAAMGDAQLAREGFVLAAMTLLAADEAYVYASMVVD